MEDKISGNRIRQIFFLLVIIAFVGVIAFSLRGLLSSFLGAVLLYILLRDYQFRFTEKKNWKPWVTAFFLMFVSIIVMVVPVYFLLESLVMRLVNSREYVEEGIKQVENIHKYIEQKTGYNVIDSLDLKKIGEWVTNQSSLLINGTLDTLSSIGTAYFVLYFMLVNGREMEKTINIFAPLKKSNMSKIEKRFNRLVMANAVGIPIVAVGQGFTLLIGYLIAGVSSPFFLFALTCIASVIPIVGGAIIYIPVAAMQLVNGDMSGAVVVLVFGIISSGVDNLLRFTVLKKLEDIHPLISIFGIILGLDVFGFVGLIFGPIMISITLILIEVYYDEFSDKDNQLIIDEDQSA